MVEAARPDLARRALAEALAAFALVFAAAGRSSRTTFTAATSAPFGSGWPSVW